MKRYILHTLLACLLLGVSCSKDDTAPADGTGVLAMSVSATRTPDTGAYDPLEHMTVRIYSQDGLVRKYDSREDIPARLELLAGTYRVTVQAGEIVPASFTTSYYEGEETLVITAGQTKAQTIVCQPVNSVVQVKFDASVTDNFETGYFAWVTGDETFDEQAAETGSVPALRFTDDGTGYYTLPEGTTSLAWQFSGTHSSRGTVEKTGVMANVQAGSKYVLTFKYSPDLPGFIEVFTVRIDPSTDDRDDEIDFKPDPTIVGVGFDYNELQRYTSGDKEYRITSYSALESVAVVAGGMNFLLAADKTFDPSSGLLFTSTDDYHHILTLTDTFFALLAAGDQSVTINISDEENSSKTTTTTYRQAGFLEPVYDLWLNTATLTVVDFEPATSVDFRLNIGGVWQTKTGIRDGDFVTATFEPEWEDFTAADWFTPNTEYGVLPYSRIKGETGIFAGRSYDYEVSVTGGAQTSGQFTTPAGDPIPNGDMSGWSTKGSGLSAFAYPNSPGDSFWNSGNNTLTKTLCVSASDKFGNAAPAAKMTSTNSVVLASGNIFSGDFHYANFTGTVDFGQPFNYTARPSAMKVSYHAKVGTVNKVRTTGDICPYISNGEQDRSRIYVAIVDWSSQHQVISALTTTKGAWDPERESVVNEGRVIGYGSLWIPDTTPGNDLIEVELPIQWYDKTAHPTEGNYSIVISCAANAYGDYFTGCSSNVMYVDDFEWVY